MQLKGYPVLTISVQILVQKNNSHWVVTPIILKSKLQILTQTNLLFTHKLRKVYSVHYGVFICIVNFFSLIE